MEISSVSQTYRTNYDRTNTNFMPKVSSTVQSDMMKFLEEAQEKLSTEQTAQASSHQTPSFPSLKYDMNIPASLDNFVVTEEMAANSHINTYIPEAFFELGIGIKLEALGTAGAALKIQENSLEISEAWDTYQKTMKEFGLTGTYAYTQSEEFRQFRKDFPDIMKELDERFKDLFKDKA